MAEAAGLAVGVLALVGTFKECIDVFSYFEAARHLGRDFELLSAKLDLEKALLLLWAQRTNLLAPDYDKRLDDSTIQDAVALTLSTIKLLLSDSQHLQQRYGLEAGNQGVNQIFDSISQKHMAVFTREFQQLNIRIGRRQDVSCRLKARWVIRDKVKFGDLLQEITYLVSKLHDLLPHSMDSVQLMSKRDLHALQSTRKVYLVSEATSVRERDLAHEAEDYLRDDCERRILRCIWFRLMDDRMNSLEPPNPKTYEWAIDSSNVDAEGNSLAKWLEHGAGLYWVSGRAGSGKSTLMKYISSATEVQRFLRCWAGPKALTVATFFFWYLGETEQKSQQGLSRALLYRILDSDHSLIQRLLPNMWQEAYGTDNDLSLPSSAEMCYAFQQLGLPSLQERKYCFFVDGLDEYLENLMDGIKFLKHLIKSPNVKIMVSSRPMQACEVNFSKVPKLYLHDLTEGDIKTYISQTITHHPHLKALRKNDCRRANRLSGSLVGKSHGVFLWVVLACRSLLEGFDNCDSWSDLEQRIDELPPELEQLFQHILSKIEHRYQARAAQLLQICYQNALVSGVGKLPSIGLALVDYDEMISEQMRDVYEVAVADFWSCRKLGIKKALAATAAILIKPDLSSVMTH